ncbi:MAG: hypothetical protein R3B84_01315 [Zavarzinella sp.]
MSQQVAVKLQAISIGVADVKFASSPRRVSQVGDVRKNPQLAKLRIKLIDIVHDKSVRGAVVGNVPFLRIVQLQVQIDAVATYAGIPDAVGIVAEYEFESELRVVVDGRFNVA